MAWRVLQYRDQDSVAVISWAGFFQESTNRPPVYMRRKSVACGGQKRD